MNEDYMSLLKELQAREQVFTRFSSWMDVIKFMHRKSTAHSDRDDILRAILRAHSKDKDSRWRTILMLIFWPALELIYFQKHGWEWDLNELWQNIVWTFLTEICRLDFESRPAYLAKKIVNKTAHRLRDRYRRLWKQEDFNFVSDREEFDELMDEYDEIDIDEIEKHELQDAEVERLQSHLKAGTIKEKDFLILAATRTYDESLREYARRTGITYECAKKRRARAEARIQRKETKNNRQQKNLD